MWLTLGELLRSRELSVANVWARGNIILHVSILIFGPSEKSFASSENETYLGETQGCVWLGLGEGAAA